MCVVAAVTTRSASVSTAFTTKHMNRLSPTLSLRVCSIINSDFGGSAAWPDARREEGASPSWGCDRRATPQPDRRRPAPTGWGDFDFWRCCSSVKERRLCSLVAPSQKSKSPPAKPEVIFEQTLTQGVASLSLGCNIPPLRGLVRAHSVSILQN